jgi:hypothetical protein
VFHHDLRRFITMKESTTPEAKSDKRFSPRASLAALGIVLQQNDLFAPIKEAVKIAQKTVKHTPIQKLYDAFISILAGAHGLVEINTRLRSDMALQRAFGRMACAEQSVVQETLSACTEENVQQMQAAVTAIYRQHSWGYGHDYSKSFQLLDIDMTGAPCGKKAQGASKGYFAGQRNRRGRQVGRVLATHYSEIVTERLFDGKTQLPKALVPLMLSAEETLELDEARRCRTIVRVDGGGGSLEDVNWLLERGYRVHGKEYSGKRASKLAQSVAVWFPDPKVEGRELGWVTEPTDEYVRPVVRIAVRCKKNNGQWGVGILISALSAREVLSLTKRVPGPASPADEQSILLSYASFYDARGGGVETSFKGGKQGLGITRRNKRCFAAQQMVLLLSALAHNVVVWAQHWLSAQGSPGSGVKRYGIMRMIRDVFHISGYLVLDALGQIVQIVLNEAVPLARLLATAFNELLRTEQVAVNLGQT